MATIREDELGLYAKVAGYLVRPEVSYTIKLIDGIAKTVPVYIYWDI